MITHLILDLDGTLVNSSPGIYHSFVLACEKFCLPPPSYAEFYPLIGPPVQEIAARLYPGFEPVPLEEFRRFFRDDYDNISYRMADWYPEVRDTLKTLSANPGISISIVTNKPTRPALNLVRSEGLASCLSRIVGIDYVAANSASSFFSSKAEALSYVLLSNSSELGQSVYVGDTPSDQAACDRCNLPFIACLYGFHRWHQQQMPPRCIERFGEIQQFLY